MIRYDAEVIDRKQKDINDVHGLVDLGRSPE